MSEAIAIEALPQGNGEHPIGWLELTCNDAEVFRTFYGGLFGWGFKTWTTDYFLYDTGMGLMGGVRVNPPAGSPAACAYIYTPDIDATLAEIDGNGGETVKAKFEVPNAGTMAFFKDPSGVIFGLAEIRMPRDYSPRPFVKAGDELLPWTIVALEFYGRDLATVKSFYSGLFGWACREVMPQYLAFNTGPCIGGTFQSHTAAAHVTPYVWVEDVTASLAKVTELGGKPLGGPMAMPGLPTFAYYNDPFGRMMGLLGPAK